MKDFLKIYKIQLIVGAYVAVVLAFAYFVAMPVVNKINSSADEIQQKKIDGELNEKRLADVPVMEENYRKFKENEGDLAIVIELNSEVELIKELESIAAQTDNQIEFKIQDAQVGKPSAKQKGTEDDIKTKLAYANYLSMQVAVEGNYVNLLNFIHKLENYKKTVNIISVSSEKKEPDNYADKLNPFATSTKKSSNSKETINSILDVVVYIKK
ncbi:MAG: hypothetical protein UT50_C0005G0020 [Candidatus Moranbacteria bacterium GW2011_GWA2_39_41]|nr:MAG: hypothetical protein UT50_C0005G0020 [Candidatus Moranbacteria bacterium GW2011_GWA2_39_41]